MIRSLARSRLAIATTRRRQFQAVATFGQSNNSSNCSHNNSLNHPRRKENYYSSMREPGSLFAGTSLDEKDPLGLLTFPSSTTTTTTNNKKDRDAPLRADVRTMGSLLGKIIQDHHSPEMFDKIEELRGLAKTWRETSSPDALDSLTNYTSQLSNEELQVIARAYTHFLAIANSAESHHRCRLLNETSLIATSSTNALPVKSDSCGGVLKELVDDHGSDKVMECLMSQQVELVLTAHPTEVNRRTILQKQRRVQEVRGKCNFI
jgi:hypothetical protein